MIIECVSKHCYTNLCAKTPILEIMSANKKTPYILTPAELEAYSRQLIVPAIGSEGQRKIIAARVLVVGCGGLGAPALTYLARAGVKTLGIVDFDEVELSNLHRQTIYKYDDVGKSKVAAARANLTAYNPQVVINAHNVRLTAQNAFNIIKKYDLVLNGTDNLPTRYLLNDAAYLLDKPLVDGAVLGFTGHVSVYEKGRGCYRCIFPNPPPPDAVPTCAEAGVLGVMPSIIGSLQALEALKIIIGTGTSLSGNLLVVDGLTMDFKTIKSTKNPDCALCGTKPTITELINYEQFCGLE